MAGIPPPSKPAQPTLSSYVKPEHKYIVIADFDHSHDNQFKFAFSDQTLGELKSMGINKIAVEQPQSLIDQIISGKLSREDYLASTADQSSMFMKVMNKVGNQHAAHGALYDGVRKAHEQGFKIGGVDAHSEFRNKLYETIATNNKANTSAPSPEGSRAAEVQGEAVNGARYQFDPAVADKIHQFAGDDRALIVYGAGHIVGEHNNIYKNLGPEQTVTVASPPTGIVNAGMRLIGIYDEAKVKGSFPSLSCDSDKCAIQPQSPPGIRGNRGNYGTLKKAMDEPGKPTTFTPPDTSGFSPDMQKKLGHYLEETKKAVDGSQSLTGRHSPHAGFQP